MYRLTPCPTRKAAKRYLAALITLFLLATGAAAQNKSAVDGRTPAGLAPGSPAGSYPLSGFETVNLFNGGLNFRLPLLKAGGRGGAGYGITLQVEQKWIAEMGERWPSGEVPMAPSPNWWQGVRPGYGPGVMHGRRGNHVDAVYPATGEVALRTLTRLTFTAADGTEYELRDQKSGGAAQTARWYPQTGNQNGYARGKVFVTADGGSATFLSDAEVTDYIAPNLEPYRLFYPTGYLLLADGTRYRIEGGLVTWIRDRNGNKVTFTYEGSRVATVADSLGRQVTFSYDDGVRHYDEIGFKGFGGQPRAIRVWYDNLSDRLRPDFGAQARTYRQLFELNSASTASQYDPSDKVSEVELPDGRRYQLYYNPYGELARVELPTGGAFEYDWDGVAVEQDLDVDGFADNAVIHRLVTTRRVYPEGGSVWASRTEYLRSSNSAGAVVEEKTTDAGGTLMARALHYFHGDVLGSIQEDPTRPSAISYGRWKEGREYRTESFDVVNGAPVLRRAVARTWRQPVAGQTWPVAGAGETDEAARPNNPQVTEELTTLSDSGQTSKRAFAYDRYGNATDAWEYDYGAGAAPAYALRHTHTDYLTTNAIAGTTYDYACDPSTTCANQNITPGVIHQRGLLRARQVYAVNPSTGVETLVAQSETRYDEAAYPLLTCGTTEHPIACTSAPQWDDPGAARRGNPTTARLWLDTASSWLETHAQYDQLGNVRYTWDARGNLSQVSYLDSFCNGDGCAGTYAPNTFAFPTATKSPKPDPSGVYGSAAELTASTVYDFYTGLVYSAKDANGQATRYEYADPLDRPTAEVRPDGGRTDVYYSQPNESALYVRTLSDLDGTRRMKAEQYFDKMGRPSRSFTWENQDASNPWLTADTLYDALGRAWRASNTYRSAGPGGGVDVNRAGTETSFDALGRVTQVKTTADAAVVRTDYSGNRVLVTDQKGRQQIGQTDAFGRLREVWEVTPDDQTRYPGVEAIPAAVTAGLPAAATYGYRSEYFYDAAGNLRRVKQGSQQRFFAYDSLGRLVRVRNPEQGVFTADGDFPALDDAASGVSNFHWSAGYVYDPNGNLAKRKDARDVTATYSYDALNRNTVVSYANDPAQTPNAHRRYDGSVGGLGRLWYSSAGATATGINEYDALGRVREQHQNFLTGTVWSPDYSVKLEYNLAGGVTSMTYPSGRKVAYQYDAAGRLGDNAALPAFKGNLGDGVERTYASQVRYDELGGMSQERFGTQTPVFNKHFYNARGQLGEIRVSTYSITNTDPGLKTNWNRGAIINHYSAAGWGASGGGSDNNGNLRQQDVFIPKFDGAGYEQGGNHDTFSQSFSYDHLNRLTRAAESWEGQTRWAQAYDYDRWGNRTINADGTWLGPLQPAPAPTPTPSDRVNETQFDKTDLQNSNRLYAPGDTALPMGQRLMRYDGAGNLVQDAHTGKGVRTYDAENRMTSAEFFAGQLQTTHYVYDADGRRVKRNVGTDAEVWQVYGVGGELLAEYGPQAAPTQPRNEYGYRGGELLVTAAPGATQPPQQGRANVALASNGGVATASSSLNSPPWVFTPAGANDGDRKGVNWGSGGGWNDATGGSFPDWLEVEFAGAKTIDEVDIFTNQDAYSSPSEPTESMAFTLYGLTQYEVQYWDGAGWASVQGGSVSGNNKVWRKFTFPAVTTTKLRVLMHASVDGYSRLAEVEAWGVPAQRSNVALAANGGVASASSSFNSPPWVFTPAGANDGDRRGADWGSGGGWNDDAPGNTFPDWLQVDFAGTKTIDEIDVFTGQDNWSSPSEPTEAMTFTQYGLTAYEVQYKDGANWVTVPGGSVSGNNKVWRKFTFPAVMTTGVRVRITASADGYSRVTELEAWGGGGGGGASGADVRWLVADQLGTPRMVLDETGSLAGVSRHDYLPFGEELYAGTGGRTPAQGYGAADNIRQRFTGYERDAETNLDYAQARYYTGPQGRFTSVDPLQSSANPGQPQSWNRYTYTLNNPLKFTDPTGLVSCPPGQTCINENTADEHYFDSELGDYVYSGSGMMPERSLVPVAGLVGPIAPVAVQAATTLTCATALPVIAVGGAAINLYLLGQRLTMETIPYSPYGTTLPDGTRPISCTAGNQALQQLQRVDSPVFSILQQGDEIKGDFTVVRGGQSPDFTQVPMSGAFGVNLYEASIGVPHGKVWHTTVRAINASGGKVIYWPEPAYPGGPMNYRHVNIFLGAGNPFTGPVDNPVPKALRVPGRP